MKWLVLAIGATITVGSHAVLGWRLHRWALRHAPGIAAWIPRDGGVILGILAGIGLIALWATG